MRSMIAFAAACAILTVSNLALASDDTPQGEAPTKEGYEQITQHQHTVRFGPQTFDLTLNKADGAVALALTDGDRTLANATFTEVDFTGIESFLHDAATAISATAEVANWIEASAPSAQASGLTIERHSDVTAAANDNTADPTQPLPVISEDTMMEFLSASIVRYTVDHHMSVHATSPDDRGETATEGQ